MLFLPVLVHNARSASHVRHEVAPFECGRGKAATRPVSKSLSLIPMCVAGNGGVRSSG
jgi:hypothetical protein